MWLANNRTKLKPVKYQASGIESLRSSFSVSSFPDFLCNSFCQRIYVRKWERKIYIRLGKSTRYEELFSREKDSCNKINWLLKQVKILTWPLFLELDNPVLQTKLRPTPRYYPQKRPFQGMGLALLINKNHAWLSFRRRIFQTTKWGSNSTIVKNPTQNLSF